MRKIFYSILLIILMPSLVEGKILYELFSNENNVYYIDPSGSDTRGDGSKNKPWSSLSHACSVIASSSTIHINPGKYIESNRCTLAPGVNIEGEGYNSLIISHYVSKDEVDALILLKSSSPGVDGNQSISNIRLDGDLTGTKAIYGHYRNNITIRNCSIENFASVGIAFKNNLTWAEPEYYAEGNKIENCMINNCGNLIVLYGQSGMTVNDNILIENERIGKITTIIRCTWLTAFKYFNNISYKQINNEGKRNFGIELWDSRGGNEIFNNEFHGGGCAIDIAGISNLKGDYDYSWWIHDNKFILEKPLPWTETGINTGIAFEATNEDAIVNNNLFLNLNRAIAISSAREPDHVKNIKIYYNIFSNIGWKDVGWGYFIYFYSKAEENYMHELYIDNNVFSGLFIDKGLSFNLNGEFKDFYFRNNIIQNVNGKDNYGWMSGLSSHMQNIFILNNIIFNNCSNNGLRNTEKVRNLVYENNIYSDPLFVSSVDYHLRSGSPAINAGIEIGLEKDFDGTPVIWKPDIGVYEYILDIQSPQLILKDDSL